MGDHIHDLFAVCIVRQESVTKLDAFHGKNLRLLAVFIIAVEWLFVAYIAPKGSPPKGEGDSTPGRERKILTNVCCWAKILELVLDY
jgi:hypothetical protein